MEPVRKFRVHIGAHKTATTHLQNSLASQRELLREAGTDYIPRRISEPLRRTSWRMAIPNNVHERRWANTLSANRQGPQVVAISDENISGGSRSLLADPFYPRIESRLRALTSLTSPARLVIFLSIRSFETLLPSAYVEAIKGRPQFSGFEIGRAHV